MSLIEVNSTDKLDSIVSPEELKQYSDKLNQLKAAGENKWSFSIVEGFFKQSSVDTDDSSYNSLDDHFGLQLESWTELIEKLKELNKSVKDPSKERYKLVFCARHGQGYHNKAVEIWGIKAWDDHYSHLEGATAPDGTIMKWGPDPFLTEKGEKQAELMHQVFNTEINKFGCPIPTKLFSSPFTRSAQTLTITMNNICIYNDNESDKSTINDKRLFPLVIENLRETIGSHLCDKRSDKETFENRMKGWGFQFEDGFQHDDIYYKDDWREPVHQQALRANSFLQHLFDADDYLEDDVVYCASHSGEIKALIVATGHRQYSVPTAGMIPMLIKATLD